MTIFSFINPKYELQALGIKYMTIKDAPAGKEEKFQKQIAIQENEKQQILKGTEQ